ncbi:MAG: 3-ketoacyl-ACP reductase [Spirochaetae bacterium HGW-Spirochaetae-5]|nr:MAG: 3-ketoacyl-ACP reductase [Spirochaetae bacterium HGW-Spirochaetae-5]
MNFNKKVVIVTGAGEGIGRAIAVAYARHGASVIIAEKNIRSAEKTSELINEFNGTSAVIPVDVSNPEDIANMISETESRFNTIDILINNAGISEWKSPYDLTVDEWDRIINTNLRSMFFCSREAAKVMRKSKRGSIINISSTRAIMSEPDSEAYAASKGGILSLTHALAASLSEDNIQVNCISPGWIETGAYSKLKETDHAQHFSRRVGIPEDIAKACLYLTDENNTFISGTNLVIDGGMTRKMIYDS